MKEVVKTDKTKVKASEAEGKGREAGGKTRGRVEEAKEEGGRKKGKESERKKEEGSCMCVLTEGVATTGGSTMMDRAVVPPALAIIKGD